MRETMSENQSESDLSRFVYTDDDEDGLVITKRANPADAEKDELRNRFKKTKGKK